MDSVTARERILDAARELGFPLVRFAPAELLREARRQAGEQREHGDFAEMGWMTETWVDRATDPDTFLAGARTVVVLALPCHSQDPPDPGDGISRGRVARYARGRDYHRLFESKLRRLVALIRAELGGEARATVDYGPLLERPYAALAGLGWLGKSTMLLVPGMGPWVLLGAIATTLELPLDRPLRKSCGSCSRCVVACPTGALGSDGSVLDSRLCISYHTIENRGPIPRELRAKFGDWVFGCDDCLDSCPVGAASPPGHADLTPPTLEHARPDLASLLQLDERSFVERFRGRAIMRAKRDGLARNACVALGNTGTPRDMQTLAAALGDISPLVRGHAAWAIGRLATRHGLRGPAEEALAARHASESDPYVLEEIECALLVLNGARD